MCRIKAAANLRDVERGGTFTEKSKGGGTGIRRGMTVSPLLSCCFLGRVDHEASKNQGLPLIWRWWRGHFNLLELHHEKEDRAEKKQQKMTQREKKRRLLKNCPLTRASWKGRRGTRTVNENHAP